MMTVWAMGYIEMVEGVGPTSSGGNTHVLQILDVGTGVKHAPPVATPDASSTMHAASHAAGDNTVSCDYYDSGAGVAGACDEAGMLRDPLRPQVHQHHALIDRPKDEYVCGTRTALGQADLPSCVWSLTGNRYAMAGNISDT